LRSRVGNDEERRAIPRTEYRKLEAFTTRSSPKRQRCVSGIHLFRKRSRARAKATVDRCSARRITTLVLSTGRALYVLANWQIPLGFLHRHRAPPTIEPAFFGKNRTTRRRYRARSTSSCLARKINKWDAPRLEEEEKGARSKRDATRARCDVEAPDVATTAKRTRTRRKFNKKRAV